MPDMLNANRGSSNVNPSIIQIDMSRTVSLLEPDKYPLTTILSKLKSRKKVSGSYKYEWLEDVLNPRWDAINKAAGYAAGDVTITVDNGDYYRDYDMLYVPRTGEFMRVTGISTNDLTVTRSWGSTAAAALVDDDPIRIVANAAIQGAEKGTSRTVLRSEEYNYMQIIRSQPFGVTGTLDAMDLYVGDELTAQRKKKILEQLVQIESSFIMGQRGSDITGAQPVYSTGGILEKIATNIYDADGTLTEANFEKSFCEDLFRYGSSKRLLLCGARVISVMNLWAKEKLQTTTADENYGLSMRKYISAHGELMIVKHHLLDGDELASTAIALDMDTLRYRYLKGREMILNTKIETPGQDAKQEEYLSEIGIEFRQEERSGKMINADS